MIRLEWRAPAMLMDVEPSEPVIELTPEASVPVTEKRRYSPAIMAVVAVLGILAGATMATLRPHPAAPAVPVVRINVGVSPYPAPATASWRGADGAVHRIDVWAGDTVTAPAVEVTVAAARYNGGPVQCDLFINGHVVDLATVAPQDQLVTCSWTATR